MILFTIGVVFGFYSIYLIIQNKLSTVITAIIAAILIIISGINYGNETDVSIENEITLTPLYNSNGTLDEGNLFYVSVSPDNVYSYKYEVEPEVKGSGAHVYEVKTIDSKKYTVYEQEDPNCDNPTLMVYKTKFKPNWVTMGFWGTETIYVFTVPEGTIISVR